MFWPGCAAMDDQLSLIDESCGLETLPSAKLKKIDRVGVHAWTNFYAAFSEGFAIHAISGLSKGGKSKVFDPFLGSGTTAVAALKLGVPVLGVDLDPFACLLSRAKVSVNVDKDLVLKILYPTKRKNVIAAFSEDARSCFRGKTLLYASGVISKIKRRIANKKTPLNEILGDSSGLYDSEVVALAALCIAADQVADVVRGSNPTWYRKAVEGEIEDDWDFVSLVRDKAFQMICDLEELKKNIVHRDVTIFNGDVRELPEIIKDFNPGIVVTSPPYLTRIDYVIKHLPNLLMLSGFCQVDIDSLRKKMIGTPKIVDEKSLNKELGAACFKKLQEIKNHESYASESYYVWTYSQYFSTMSVFMMQLKKVLSVGSRGVVVVQDSYYKDIKIQLSSILGEMLRARGFLARVIRIEKLSTHMKNINRKQSVNVKKNGLSEDVLFFEVS